jgi:hypothetical protein
MFMVKGAKQLLDNGGSGGRFLEVAVILTSSAI